MASALEKDTHHSSDADEKLEAQNREYLNANGADDPLPDPDVGRSEEERAAIVCLLRILHSGALLTVYYLGS